MSAKKHVVVLMGGMSAEYEVSMRSGAQIAKHLDRDAYDVSSVEITQHGEWVFPGRAREYLDVVDALPKLKSLHPDCVFIALHGPFGEDGRMQGLLDLLGVPYTGSGCAASALSMDKVRAKAVAEHGGVLVADHVVFDRPEWDRDPAEITRLVSDTIRFPCVVKCPTQGSSLGMAMPQTVTDFAAAVREVLRFGSTVLVEKYLSGLELTCGVLDLDETRGAYALPVTEIRPVKAKFFDYGAKYTPGATKEITPAQIDDAVRDNVQEIAVRAHELMGCRGFSRSDMILCENEVYWLEINTIPGFTETSLLPQMAAADDMSFTELVGAIVEAAMI
jgi:D-alanine-D-alanine ligase